MTSSNKLLLIVLIVLIVSPHGHLLVAAVPIQFDYHILSLTWPKSYCELTLDAEGKTECWDAGNVPKHFTIHGLWPTLKNRIDKDLEFCSDTNFEFSQVDPKVQVRASDNWPDIKYYRKANLGKTAALQLNKAFWATQWKKHGTCSNLDQNEYMNLALNKYDDVLPSISKAMKTHSPGGTINVEVFTTDLHGSAGVKPRLYCKNLNNQQILSEIHFYFDNSAIPKPIDARNPACDTSKPARFP